MRLRCFLSGVRRAVIVCAVVLPGAFAGCNPVPPGTGPGPVDTSDDNGGAPDDGSGGGGSANDGVAAAAGFSVINGNEVLVEGTVSDPGDGSSRRRDERFTAVWSLQPIDAEVGQGFVGNVLVDIIRGDLQGMGHLTYSESGTDFTPDLECPTQTYSGQVEWDATVTGTYTFVPSLGTLNVMASATEVSSPEYTVTYTNPGCPEFDSTSPSQYVWPGPGQGTWGFVTIAIQDGIFESRLDNPLGNDLGEADYYEIHVGAESP